jgi:hypothetical protein
MRSKFTRAAVIFAAVLAFSTAAVASATAHEFIASKVPGKLAGKQTGGSAKLVWSWGTIECKAAKVVEGEVSGSPTATLSVGLMWEGCEIPGFETGTFNHPAKIVYNASGFAKLENTVTLVTGTPPIDCESTLEPQEFKGVTYKNLLSPNRVEAAFESSGIKVTRSGFGCVGGTKGTFFGGHYVAHDLIEELEGNLEWK